MKPDEFVSRLSGAKRTINGWAARCPAHDDLRASLSVGTGADGRVLLRCFAGCTTESVVAALGLELRDLMPDSGTPTTRTTKAHNGRTWPSLEAFARTLPGTLAGVWHYHARDGSPALAVVRVDDQDGKTFRPLHPVVGGWAKGDPAGPLPLYALPRLLADPIACVFVVEGEKCADAAAALGFTAATSANGSQGARKTDRSPLAGRDVIILPDHIRLTSGGPYDIRDPGSVAMMKSRMFIAFPDGQHWTCVPYLHVAAIECLRGAVAGGAGRLPRPTFRVSLDGRWKRVRYCVTSLVFLSKP